MIHIAPDDPSRMAEQALSHAATRDADDKVRRQASQSLGKRKR